MNVVKIQGGLGNQLFQYAFGKAQERFGINVQYDLSWFAKHKNVTFPRPYRLNKFGTIVQQIKPIPGGLRSIKDPVMEANLNFLKKDNCYFEGYWQCVDYYGKIRGQLCTEFRVREEFFTEDFRSYKNQIVSGESTGVHVRRGDYIGKKGFHTLPLSYYLHALTETKGDIFIFSDGIDWCIRVFKQEYFDRKVTFIHLEDYLDFELMKSCTHHVISHSTFSWWAAFLNENKGKVVCPSQWTELHHRNSISRNGVHYPKEWIKHKTELCMTS
jgi:hypothetical protein